MVWCDEAVTVTTQRLISKELLRVRIFKTYCMCCNSPRILIFSQLEEHIIRLREELDREREERNYFQLERDKIHTFWEITKRQLEEKKADLRNREREMEEAEESHQTEIRVLLIMISDLDIDDV